MTESAPSSLPSAAGAVGPTAGGRPRVLSGMRPTGRLHLGNYMGALANWVKLQNSGQYECYFFIADLHALTTDYADPSRIKLNTLDVALDFLAAGLDPGKSTIFIQSHVPQHAELNLLLGMITPLGWLERVPTYKEQQENLTGKDLTTYGFLGYPLLMSSDILLYQPQFVPVGQDQVAHVELTREVARRFNSMYKSSIFPEPEGLLTPSPKLPGIDGRKMSKSYGNTIGLTEDPKSVAQKVETMSTNGQRPRHADAGDPDQCPVGDLHKVFSSSDVVAGTQAGCRVASIGCKECKALAAKSVSDHVAPIHAKRRELESDVDRIWELLKTESKKAEVRAEETMVQVREVLGLSKSLGDVRSLFAMPTQQISKIDQQPWKYDFRALSNNVEWKGNSEAERKKKIRVRWILEIKRNITLTQEANRQFDSIERELEEPALTSKGKRVLIDSDCIVADATNSTVLTNPEWNFSIPPKSFEVWALLVGTNWEGDLYLDDFILPQKVFSQSFAQAKKSLKKDEKIPISLRKDGERFLLSIHGSEPVDITELRSNYEPLK
jgi:tryptophanyl-tRNA synthetase